MTDYTVFDALVYMLLTGFGISLLYVGYRLFQSVGKEPAYCPDMQIGPAMFFIAGFSLLFTGLVCFLSMIRS